MKYLSAVIFVSLAVFFLTNCKWQCAFAGAGFAGSERYFEWGEKQQALFSSYIGKSSEEIKEIFGEPVAIYGSQAPVPRLPEGADFFWSYGSLPSVKSEGTVHDFYFKNNKLIFVEVP